MPQLSTTMQMKSYELLSILLANPAQEDMDPKGGLSWCLTISILEMCLLLFIRQVEKKR